jgi:hypothetical protein
MSPTNRSTHRLKWTIFSALLLLLPPAALSQGSATVARANLNYLVDNAQTIVRGNVVSAIVEPHPQFANVATVLVTISVSKTFKGQVGTTFTFRQFLLEGKNTTIPGGYHKSEELLLFLNPTSLYGLTSPVGLEQGRFRVLRDNQGNRFALNGKGNVGLFADAAATSSSRGVTFSPQAKAMLATTSGRVSLATLEQTVQTLVAVHP